jgi:hypothetical protein
MNLTTVGYDRTLYEAGLQKHAARRSTKILQGLMEKDPSGGLANGFISRMGSRGVQPRKFIKELGAGQEGVADLVATPKGVMAEKLHLQDTFFTSRKALDRKQEYLEKMTKSNPELFSKFYGARDVQGAGPDPARAFLMEYMPGEEVGDMSYTRQGPILDDLEDRLRNAEEAANMDIQGGDLHGGNIRLDAEGTPKIVDTLAAPKDSQGIFDDWGYNSPHDAPARFGGEPAWRMPHLADVPEELQGRVGGAMKADIYRGANMDDIIYAGQDMPEAARRRKREQPPRPRQAQPGARAPSASGDAQSGFGGYPDGSVWDTTGATTNAHKFRKQEEALPQGLGPAGNAGGGTHPALRKVKNVVNREYNALQGIRDEMRDRNMGSLLLNSDAPLGKLQRRGQGVMDDLRNVGGRGADRFRDRVKGWYQ